MSQVILEIEGVSKSFPGVRALDDMRLSLSRGQIHALTGENGAGKSTLMKIVSGVYRPDEGRILLDGREVSFNNPIEAFDSGIAIIYQETSLFEEMTVLENLFLSHELKRRFLGLPILDYASMEKQAQKTFRSLSADISVHSRIRELGMAQKQMVEIAKALTYDSKILVLDEPTASLTMREVDALFQIVRRLRDQGVGIIYISHRMEEIFDLCDHVTVMRDGRFISTQPTSETTRERLIADMVGRAVDCYVPKQLEPVGEPLFRVENFRVPGFVRQAEFNLQRNEIVGFAGLAGSGRTELAEAICGLREKTSGRVFVDGEEVSISNYGDAMQAGIVYVSEDRGKYGLVTEMSIQRNLTLPQLSTFVRGGLIDEKAEKTFAEEYVKKVDVKTPDTAFPVMNLSGGNQQKVSIAKALGLDPEVLILDEPTRGVDVGAKAEIHDLIVQLSRQNRGVVVISSELPELLCLCDRVYVMADSEIAACFPIREATQEKILEIALGHPTAV